MTEHIKGLVLRALPFKEHDRILTLLTPSGILKLFVKGKKKNHLQQNALASPLTIGHYLIQSGKQELHRFVDGTIINQHLRLRASYDALISALKITEALYQTQWIGKPSQALFALTESFLSRLEKSTSSSTLLSAFLVKLMKHEGSFDLKKECHDCGSALTHTFRVGGEVFCEKDAPPQAISFSKSEEETLLLYAHARSFETIESFLLSESMEKKIEKLFQLATAE